MCKIPVHSVEGANRCWGPSVINGDLITGESESDDSLFDFTY
jgi:hypothetical protein